VSEGRWNAAEPSGTVSSLKYLKWLIILAMACGHAHCMCAESAHAIEAVSAAPGPPSQCPACHRHGDEPCGDVEWCSSHTAGRAASQRATDTPPPAALPVGVVALTPVVVTGFVAEPVLKTSPHLSPCRVSLRAPPA